MSEIDTLPVLVYSLFQLSNHLCEDSNHNKANVIEFNGKAYAYCEIIPLVM